MFLYRPVPTVQYPGTITEEEAYRDKGLKVRLGPITPGSKWTRPRMYYVEILDSLSPFLNIKTCIMVIVGLSLFFALVGRLFMKFCAPLIIDVYLKYPSANCTVLSYNEVSAGDNGMQYVLQVAYYDSKGVLQYGKISKSSSQFIARNFTVGSEFACVYKGSFLMDKETIQHQLNYSNTIWYLGVLIPIPTVFSYLA